MIKQSHNQWDSFPLLISRNNFRYGIKWIGNGSEYCKNPKLILEKAKISLDQTIKRVRIQYVSDAPGGGEFISPLDQSYWKYSDSNPFQACHIFFLPKPNKMRPISMIEFSKKSSAYWNIISPGTPIDTRGFSLYNISGIISAQYYNFDYEVYHMLDYNNH